MIALHLPEVDKAFLYGRVGCGEQVAPDTVHVRAADSASLVRDFDDNILFCLNFQTTRQVTSERVKKLTFLYRLNSQNSGSPAGTRRVDDAVYRSKHNCFYEILSCRRSSSPAVWGTIVRAPNLVLLAVGNNNADGIIVHPIKAVEINRRSHGILDQL